MKLGMYVLSAGLVVSLQAIDERLELPSDQTKSVAHDNSIEHAPRRAQYVKLSASVLQLIDGIPGLMDAEKIRGMNYIIQELMRMKFGKLVNTKTKERVPEYEFQGKKYTLRELVKIEEDMLKTGSTKALEPLLNKIRGKKPDDAHWQGPTFAAITDPYLAQARGIQTFLIRLITESCQKRNRENSLLMNWGNIASEHEQESFRKNITSFKTLDIFCTDLIHFLGDLKFSCPKAMAKYHEKYPTKQ